MLSLIRKNQHFLTFCIVILTIISFIWLYNRTNLSQIGVNDVATIYGHVVVRSSFEREVRDYRLAIALGLSEFINDLGGFAENEDVALTSFIFNILVLQHEAPLLNILPTDENIATVIEKLPVFQTDGAFDSNKYALFMKEQLAPRGFSERHLEEVVRDSLYFKRVYQLITAPVIVSEAQVRDAARIFQPVVAHVLRFDRDHYINTLPKDAVSAQEKQAFYEKNKGLFVSEEERAVDYLAFTLPLNQKKLQGKERVKAMQELSERAVCFKQEASENQLYAKNFEKSAAEHKLHLIKTDSFKKKEMEASGQGKTKLLPPELILPSFKLSKVGDISEVIESGDCFYLISLARITPSRQLTLSEVESTIEKLLKEQKATQAAQEEASKSLAKIHEELGSGKTFVQAQVSLPQKWVIISGSPAATGAKQSAENQEFLAATLPLQEGEVSEICHARSGDFILYLQKRMPLSDTDWNTYHAKIESELLEQERHLLFFEWLRKARAEAKINIIDGHHRPSLFSALLGK